MSYFTVQERTALSVVGVATLLGLGVLLWQRQKPPLVIEDAALAVKAARWDRALDAARRVDVNTASVAELERLPGVGPTLAQRIIHDRQAHGPFTTPDELSRVPGIGPRTIETLQDYVRTE